MGLAKLSKSESGHRCSGVDALVTTEALDFARCGSRDPSSPLRSRRSGWTGRYRRSRRPMRVRVRRSDDWHRALQFLENLLGARHKSRRAFADQPMAPRRDRAMHRPRHGHHATAELVAGDSRRDLRTGIDRRLDHKHAERQPGNDAIPSGKVARPRVHPHRELAQNRAPHGTNLLVQLEVLVRIGAPKSAAQHGNRSAADSQCGAMRGGIDAAGTSTDDQDPPTRKCAGEP